MDGGMVDTAPPVSNMAIEDSLIGGFEPYPSEKYMIESVGMMTFPIYGKIKHVPNHQPFKDFPSELNL